MREIIFKQVDYDGLLGKIKSKMCISHVDRKIIDVKLKKNISIIIWECIYCRRRELWICWKDSNEEK